METEDEEGDKILCIFCCCLFSYKSGDKSKSSFSHVFQKFLEEVNLKLGNEDEILLMAMSVCPECSEVMRSTVEWKEKTEVVEKNVRELQMKILTEMKELDDCLGRFHNELNRMETTIRNSDLACLEVYVENGRYNKNVFDLRKNIESAVQDLAGFKDDLETKLNYSDKMTEALAHSGYVPPSRRSEYAGSKLRSRKPVNRFNIFKRAKRKNKTQRKSARFLDTSSSDEEKDDKLEEMEGISKKKNIKQEVDMAESDYEDHLGFAADSDNIADASDSAPETGSTIRYRRPRKTSKPSMLPPSLKGIPTWRQIILQRLDNWKDGEESRSFWELTCGLEHQIALQVENFQPPSSHSEMFRYDHDQRLLTCYSIPILFNDERNAFQCSKCDYTTPPYNYKKCRIHRYMLKHIQGKHLGPFTCLQCGSQQSSPRAITTHMMTKHGTSDEISICDICGRPLAKASIESHKLVHMNAEEKEEALRLRNLKPKKEVWKASSSKGPNVHHQCSTCGKEFPSKGPLSRHELSHLAREERETVQCPTCGRTMLKTTLSHHIKMQCSAPGEPERPLVKCFHCDKMVKNPKELKRHVARKHSEAAINRPFKCTDCPKDFKLREDLNRHSREIHGDKNGVTETWTCEHCGKVFNVKRYWKRHNCRGDK